MSIVIGTCIGICLTVSTIGIFSVFMLIIFLSLGMIRIKPLFTFLDKNSRKLFPEFITTLESNIKQSFKVRETSLKEGKYIFLWHPHGAFPSSIYFHTQSKLTEWPKHLTSRGVVFSGLQFIPFVNEIFSELDIIPTEYYPMMKALETSSISLLPGGMREMLYKDTTILRKRRGIFKLSLETGSPLVPVLSKGEAELCEILELPECIQDFMKSFDSCLPIPTLTSVSKFLGITRRPLKVPIHTIIGDPIPVEKVEEPSEQQIAELRKKYIEALSKMYKKEIGRELKVI